MARGWYPWRLKPALYRFIRGQRPPLRQRAVSAVTGDVLPIRLNILDPQTKMEEELEFRNVNVLDEYVKVHKRGMLALVRPNLPLVILRKQDYRSLDPSGLYTIKSSYYKQGVLAEKHGQVFHKAWENKCRLRLTDWFEEEGVYVVEQERVLYESGNAGQPMADWQGVWAGVDGTIFFVESKYTMTMVYPPSYVVLMVGHHRQTTAAIGQDGKASECADG
jgi:hypothetical protein